jgi:hypothetical protein
MVDNIMKVASLTVLDDQQNYQKPYATNFGLG